VSSGQRISRALAGARIFPAMVVQMAAIGEESGSLDQMLGKTADFFEAEVDARVKGLASLLEPLMIVILGLLIGGIVVALYLPIFQLGAIA
jgi:type IV pilus assembly protein PilC